MLQVLSFVWSIYVYKYNSKISISVFTYITYRNIEQNRTEQNRNFIRNIYRHSANWSRTPGVNLSNEACKRRGHTYDLATPPPPPPMRCHWHHAILCNLNRFIFGYNIFFTTEQYRIHDKLSMDAKFVKYAPRSFGNSYSMI